MAKRPNPLKRWRERRAAKAAFRGDTAERLVERRKRSDQPDVKDAAGRASGIGLGGDIAGGL